MHEREATPQHRQKKGRPKVMLWVGVARAQGLCLPLTLWALRPHPTGLPSTGKQASSSKPSARALWPLCTLPPLLPLLVKTSSQITSDGRAHQPNTHLAAAPHAGHCHPAAACPGAVAVAGTAGCGPATPVAARRCGPRRPVVGEWLDDRSGPPGGWRTVPGWRLPLTAGGFVGMGGTSAEFSGSDGRA